MATVGIFVLLLGAALYFCRPILLPVVAAVLIGTTLAPIVKAAARHRISPWATAIVLGLVLVTAAGTAVTLLANPVSEWIAKAPEIGVAIKQKLYVLDRPLAALRELQEVLMPSAGKAVAVEQSQLGMVTPVISVVTPAVAEITLFFVTLIFFLADADGFSQIHGVVLHDPRRQAPLHPHRQRHRGPSCVLCRDRDRHQFRPGRGGRDRRVAVRLSEPDHLRNVGHGAQLHSVYRRRLHDPDPARRLGS